MEMTSHLTNNELDEFLADPAKGLGTHLETCEDCLREVARLREAVHLYRPDGHKSEAFWQQQRWAIQARIESEASPVGHPMPRAAWAAATAMILAALLVLGIRPKPAPERLQIDPDHELLIAVERAVHSEVPTALEPAALLAREISDSSPTSSLPPVLYQEKNHAE
jgi:hypothetical protein